MKNRAVCGVVLVAGLLGGGGCATIRELPSEERRTEPAGSEYALCRELLTAFLKNDAEAFRNCLPEETRKKFTRQVFETTRKSVVDSMGSPISFQYVTALELSTFTPHIWKIRFKRTDRGTGREFTSELLFRIIAGRLDNQPVILGFQFL